MLPMWIEKWTDVSSRDFFFSPGRLATMTWRFCARLTLTCCDPVTSRLAGLAVGNISFVGGDQRQKKENKTEVFVIVRLISTNTS